MDALIDRLKAAATPDRELDAEICKAVWPEWERPNDPIQFGLHCPFYTASIDAAVTLVPVFDGKQRACWWKLEQSQWPPGVNYVGEKSLYYATIKFFENDSGPPKAWGISDSPAIAICIASLKAISSQRKRTA